MQQNLWFGRKAIAAVLFDNIIADGSIILAATNAGSYTTLLIDIVNHS